MTDGTLVLVVGPSGAGKDSLIAGAKAALSGDNRFAFARRTITRPSGAGGENHVEATPEAFAAARAAGAFCLSWRAHGLEYGIPRAIEADLDSGRCVVANVSRGAIAQARARPYAVCVAHVTAPRAVLAERIARRGREDAAAVARRLARASRAVPVGDDVVTIANDGPLEDAVRRFTMLLRRCADDYSTAVSR